MASRCYTCKKEEESLHHLLWYCDFTKRVWKWLSAKFQLRNHCTSISDISKAVQGRSPMIKQLWGAATVGTLTILWKHRNKIYHEDYKANFTYCTGVIRKHIRSASFAGLGATFRNSSGDFLLVIWRKIGVNTYYMAECLAILESVEMALLMNWTDLWIESDSVASFRT
ncbi:hypothetical protein IFM89_026525, partial [Coptis chinensis]